jgi:DNA-binding MarR family transcriptional regulator
MGTTRQISSPNSQRRFDSAQQAAFLNLWRTYDLLKQFEEEIFAAHDLSAQQYNALRLLRAESPHRLRTSELGRRLISRAPDMTRLLDRLEARGLVERERLPENRRVVEVGITPAGLQLLRDLSDSVRDCHAHQLGHLSAEELRSLNMLLNRCREPHEPANSPWPPVT